MKNIVLFAVMMALVACTADLEMEILTETSVATRASANLMGNTSPTDTLTTRDIPTTDPEGDRLVFYNTGSIIHGPTLESGNVLWTEKSYLFEYDPTEVPPALYPDWVFYKSTFDIQSGPQTSSTRWNQNISMTHTFTQPGSYLVTGTTMWRDPYSCVYDSSGVGHFDYGEHRAKKTFTVVKHPKYSISISGPNTPIANTVVAYSVPTTLPAGITFTGWTITPSSYTATGGTTGKTLNIKFTSPWTNYVLTARFRLPDGSTHDVKKSVSVGDPVPTLVAPTITANKTSVKVGQTATFTVSPPRQSGVTWEWEQNGFTFHQTTDPWITLTGKSSDMMQSLVIINSMSVRCRAKKGNSVSPWSNKVTVGVTN